MDLDAYPQHGRDSGMERAHRLLPRAHNGMGAAYRSSGLRDRPQLRTDRGPRQLFNCGRDW